MASWFRVACTTLVVALFVLPNVCGRPAAADESDTIVFREGLILPAVGVYGRVAVHRDTVQRQRQLGTWKLPKEGDALTAPDGSERRWVRATANDSGQFQRRELVGGYASFVIPSPVERIMLLEAAGHSMVYAGDAIRAGDPYSHGYLRVPVRLRAGDNEFLFHVGRGSLRAKLVALKAPIQLDLVDSTTPDLVVGESVETQAAVVVINGTDEPFDNLAIESQLPGAAAKRTPLSPFLPLAARKVPFSLTGPAPMSEGECQIELRIVRKQADRWEPLDQTSLKLRVVRAEQTRKRTFVSQIDGSVQYYAHVPRQSGDGSKGESSRPGLVLTLHGASVEALGQAQSYAPKPDLQIVAATNRRPYGFDWEDWGRLDALEVLELAQHTLDVDPTRIYLTGHSMGGHGTWQIGAHYPDRFAAIGPSAGWVSMWSYAGAQRIGQPDAVTDLTQRAASPSDTLGLARNYRQQGVYVLHGDADDNVPVEQARTMRQQLATFHPDFVYHEEPGMGHWWGKEGVGGAACVDWPPLFDFFRTRRIRERKDVQQVEFVTMSPGVSSRCQWVEIYSQQRHLKPSSVNLRCQREARRFVGETNNVERLSIDVSHLPPGLPIAVELDGQKFDDVAWPESAEGGRLRFARGAEGWAKSAAPARRLKGPHRYGPFKEAFRNRVVLVYGTHGTPEENRWLLAKARYDSESFWYRGNASLEVISDDQFVAARDEGRSDYDHRNVILYGHAGLNRAWPLVMSDSAVEVTAGRVRVGERELVGEDLACLFVQPRTNDDESLVGVIAGTGIRGLRMTERLPYFLSGVAYPDCAVFGGNSLELGNAGVLGSGYFGSDWRVESGEFAWR